MVVKNKKGKEEKEEKTEKKIGFWIARLIVMILFLYLAAILFNYFPLLPIYGSTYLPLGKKMFKEFYTNNTNQVWAGNLTDLIQLYKDVYDQLDKNQSMEFTIDDSGKKTIGNLLNNNNNNEDVVYGKIIKNMLINPETLSTIRDRLSKKNKHFFASVPITTALLKIAEFNGLATIDENGSIINDSTKKGIINIKNIKNPEGKKLSIVSFSNLDNTEQLVYDVNDFCSKNKFLWYFKQFYTLITTTIGSMFMWPIYYLHEAELIQTTSIDGNKPKCSSDGVGNIMRIIIIILGILFVVYNAYSRFYSLFESIITMFRSGKDAKDIILWLSIGVGILLGILGLTIFKMSDRKIYSTLSQPILRGLINHFGLIKSVILCLIGAVILGTIWSMSLTGSWMLLAVVAFFFPIAGMILIYLTKSEMANTFSNNLSKSITTKSITTKIITK